MKCTFWLEAMVNEHVSILNKEIESHSMEKMNEELNKIKADKYRAVQVMELKIGELETSQKDLLKEISLFESGME